MALSKKKEQQKKQEFKFFDGVKVVRCHDFGNGKISFDAIFDDSVEIYGMNYIEGKKKSTGEEYAFISFPQIKGSDGNYYNRAYLVITDELKDSIISQLEQMLS